ncbi:hypothetical protein D3C78_566780 [compost metagenome]
MGDVALPGEGHAQRAVDEELDGRIGGVGDGADFLQVQLAGQHQLRETGLIEELCPLQGADVRLGTGVQFDRRNVQFHHTQVLDDQRIDAGVVQLVDQLAGRLQFVVVQDGIDGGEHPGVVTTGEFHQFSDIAHFVAGVVAGAEARATDVDGIGAMQDGLAGDGDIAGRAEQFQVMFGQRHSFFSQACHGRGVHCSGETPDRHPYAARWWPWADLPCLNPCGSELARDGR